MIETFYSLMAQTDGTDAPAETPVAPANENSTTTGQDGSPPAGDPADNQQPQEPGNPWSMVVLILLMFAVIYFVMMRPQKKREEERKKLMESLTKNDRVQTIGGIIGTVIDVKDENEVVIKIDESNNTKLHIARSAIARVITSENKGEPLKQG